MRVTGSPAARRASAARRRACWRHAAKVSPVSRRKSRASVRPEPPASRPQSSSVRVEPGSAPSARQMGQALVAWHGKVEAESGERRDLVQDEGHQPAGRPALVVEHGQGAGAQDELAEQGRDGDDAHARGHPGRRVRPDVERAHGHRARQPDLVHGARGHPHRALRGHRPAPLVGAHQHHAGGREDELGPRVEVPRDVLPGGEVLRHGCHGAGHLLIVRGIGGSGPREGLS